MAATEIPIDNITEYTLSATPGTETEFSLPSGCRTYLIQSVAAPINVHASSGDDGYTIAGAASARLPAPGWQGQRSPGSEGSFYLSSSIASASVKIWAMKV